MAPERTAIPREFSDPRRFTRRFRLILAGVAFAAVSGPIGCMAAVANRPVTTPAPEVPRHQDYAAAVAESYLDGQALPVPVARGIDPDGGRVAADDRTAIGEDPRPAPIPHSWVIPMRSAVAAIPAGSGERRTVETHRFLVGTPSGPFVLAVPLVETRGGGPALGAPPSIEPFVPDADAAALDPLDWSAAYATTRPTATLEERVGEWARAFAADDRRRLLEITGDGRSGVEYVGLGAWKLTAAPEVGGLFTRADGTAGTHVELPLVAAHDRKVTTRVSFDLLVRNAGEPLPEIVAWGPAGSAVGLTAFQNATRLPTETAAVTTTSTAAPAGAAEARAEDEAGTAG
jgi:hypothetical protein